MTIDINAKAAVAENLKIDCIFSAKAHYNAASLWRVVHYSLGISTTLLAALMGLPFLKSFQVANEIGIVVVTVATAIATYLKPSEKALLHKAAGDVHLALRNEIRTLQATRNGEHGISTTELERLTRERNKLLKESPNIPHFAYRKARSGIELGEADY